MEPNLFGPEVLESSELETHRPDTSSSYGSTSASSSSSNMSGDAGHSAQGEALDGDPNQLSEDAGPSVLKIGLDRTQHRRRSTSSHSRMQLEAGPQLLDYSEPLQFGMIQNEDENPLLARPGDVPHVDLEPVPVHSAISMV